MSVTFGQRNALNRLSLASKLYKSNPLRYHEDLGRITREVLEEFGVVPMSMSEFEHIDESLIESSLAELESWHERCCSE